MTRDTAAEPRTAAGRRIDAAFRAAYERGDRSASWQDAREWILAIEAEAAAPGPALTTADVARALIESDLIPRYMEYARLSPSMNPAETIEHIAATWAPFVLARLAPAAAEPSADVVGTLRAFTDDWATFATDPDGDCWLCGGPTAPVEDHDEDGSDCLVALARRVLAAAREAPAAAEPAATGGITVLPPASWAEGAADLLERALYLRSMSSDDAAPVEKAITDHLNHSMRAAAAEPADEALRLLERAVELVMQAGARGRYWETWLPKARAYLAAHPAPEEPRDE